MSWRYQAACRGVSTELFFAETVPDIQLVKRICADCPVREDCLEYALEARETDGIFGGLTAVERNRERRRRQRAVLRERRAMAG